MNFRGWVLYVLFNDIEDHLVKPVSTPCWYLDYLHPHQVDCHGRVFDFSDHVVLYFAQILPIALVEVMYGLERPYWDASHAWLVPRVLGGGMIYLYVIVFLGFFKTAQFFHTGPEIFAGFCVSLVLQVPLMLLQCYVKDGCGNGLRSFLFGLPSITLTASQ